MEISRRNRTWTAPVLFALCLVPFAAVGGGCTAAIPWRLFSRSRVRPCWPRRGVLCRSISWPPSRAPLLAAVCGRLGYALSRAVGLMGPLGLKKEKLLPTLGVTLGCGVFFSLGYWTFGRWLPQVRESYESGLLTRRPDNWLSYVFYGGIIEEVLLRLFCMSLAAFLIWKLFFRRYDKEEIPRGVFMAANVLCALLFAAGHLSATASMYGSLTPLVLVRCFLLNGGLGLAFGWLYRRYGVQYAMLGHAGAHTISKLTWLALI